MGGATRNQGQKAAFRCIQNEWQRCAVNDICKVVLSVTGVTAMRGAIQTHIKSRGGIFWGKLRLMGTEIQRQIAGVSLSYAKNHMGLDFGFLFQDGDATRRKLDGINYE